MSEEKNVLVETLVDLAHVNPPSWGDVAMLSASVMRSSSFPPGTLLLRLGEGCPHGYHPSWDTLVVDPLGRCAIVSSDNVVVPSW